MPHKNIRLLGGRPLLAYTIEVARLSTEIDRVVVSTESSDVAAIARQWNAEVPFLRPAALAEDDTPMTAVVRHVLDELDARDEAPDMVVLLQPTVPFRHVDDLDDAICRLRAASEDAIVSVSPVPDEYHARWQLMVDGTSLIPAMGGSLADLPPRRQDISATFFRNGALYAFKSEAFRRTGSIYGREALAHIVPGEPPININTLEDWDRAERQLKRVGSAH